jgi:hypothetical protein
MTPEEIEALKKRAEEAEATAEAAKNEAELQRQNAENAIKVNVALQEQIVKVGEETKSDLPKVNVSGKLHIFVMPTFKHGNNDFTAKEAAKSKDEEFLKELIDAEVIILSK